MYKVLIIVGETGSADKMIDLQGEIDKLVGLGDNYKNLDIDIIEVGTSEVEIVSILSLNDTPYDAVHLLGHADKDGFYLASDEILPPPKILGICSDAGARMVFINSCETAATGQYLVNNKLAVAICYAVKVVDKDAIINAIRFYSAMGRSSDSFLIAIKDGYQAADPGDGTLLWLTNGEYTTQIIEPIKKMVDDLSNKLFGVDEKHDIAFDRFDSGLSSLNKKLSTSISDLTKSASITRAVVLSVVIALAAIMAISGLGTAQSQTIPPVNGTIPPVNGTIPPAASPVPPTKKPKPTNSPASPVPPTKKPKPTKKPSTNTPGPTREPSTNTPEPTREPTKPTKPTNTPAPTKEPLNTPEPTREPTRPTPINIPTSTPTLTPIEATVQSAVEATVLAWSGCEC